MKSVERVSAEAGRGLVGDRYHGTRHHHVSVQSLKSLAEASEVLGSPVEAWATRRNITISAGDVPRKPGDRFAIGSVQLEVVRIAAPCRLLDDVIGMGAARALHNRAGSVCRVLSDGDIAVSDEVHIE